MDMEASHHCHRRRGGERFGGNTAAVEQRFGGKGYGGVLMPDRRKKINRRTTFMAVDKWFAERAKIVPNFSKVT